MCYPKTVPRWFSGTKPMFLYFQSQSISGGKPGKKKSWYNALYPTYKSRAEDFKKIFSALPQEEKLIVGTYKYLI